MKNHSDDDANLSFVYSTRRPSEAAACVFVVLFAWQNEFAIYAEN